MKVIFFFGHSDCDGEINCAKKEKLMTFEDDVVRIYIKGCKYKEVGDGFYFPNLEIVTQKIAAAFNKEEKTLDYQKLTLDLDKGLYAILCNKSLGKKPIKVDELFLEGYSRGGVTTYAMAQGLDHLGIPIHLFVNQAVPGEQKPIKRLLSKYSDISACNNIKSAIQVVATHDNSKALSHQIMKQMITKLPPETSASTFLVPHQAHHESQSSSPIHYHLGKRLAELGYVKDNHYEQKIYDWYRFPYGTKSYLFETEEGDTNMQEHRGYCFTPSKLSQPIFNVDKTLEKDPVYTEFLIKEAQKILEDNTLVLNEQQAFSILSLSKLHFDPKQRKAFHEEILRSDEKAKKLQQIICKTEEICSYLKFKKRHSYAKSENRLCSLIMMSDEDFQSKAPQTLQAPQYILTETALYYQNPEDDQPLHLRIDNQELKNLHDYFSKQSEWPELRWVDIMKIRHEAKHLVDGNLSAWGKNYQQKVYQLSFDFLQKENPSPKESKKFAQDLYRAELEFRKKALSKTSILRMCLRIITNFITHITGIGLMINAIHKYKTGNWLLFKHEEKAEVVRNNRRNLFKDYKF
jgi:hypothetical protein